MKSLKKLYSMAICFASAILLLFCITSSMLSILDLTLPQYRYKSHFTKFSSIEKFISSKEKNEKAKLRSLNQEDIIGKMKFERASYIQEKKDKAIEDLIRQVGMIIVGIVFWIIHWRMYKLEIS